MKNKKKIFYTLLLIALIIAACSCFVFAGGLVDDTVNSAHEYSKYPLLNYQLDFFVDNTWDWLPWNWKDGISKTVMYGLYSITDMVWKVILFLGNFIGFLVQQAFKLDFISQTADKIGRNIQVLTGVSPSGFSSSGFFVSSILLLVLVLGAYVTYMGLVKRQTTKVFQSVISFALIGMLSTSFFAFAPYYIKSMNDFSNDLSGAALSIGSKLILPNSDNNGDDPTGTIRDSVFSLMVRQPWLLLQFGDTDETSVGSERIENILGKSPFENRGKDREEAVKNDIQSNDNGNLTISGVLQRLAMVMLLLVFNLVIAFFILSLCGIMIFTQMLFIIYAVFLPLGLIVALIPGQQNTAKKVGFKLFNIIINRAAISIVISITFCVSTMLYSMTSQFPFLVVLFLQLLLFLGVHTKLNDILGMLSLQGNEAQQAKNQFRRGYSRIAHAVNIIQLRNLNKKLGNRDKNTDTSAGAGGGRNSSYRNRRTPAGGGEVMQPMLGVGTSSQSTNNSSRTNTQTNGSNQNDVNNVNQKDNKRSAVSVNDGDKKSADNKGNTVDNTKNEKQKDNKRSVIPISDKIDTSKKDKPKRPVTVNNTEKLAPIKQDKPKRPVTVAEKSQEQTKPKQTVNPSEKFKRPAMANSNNQFKLQEKPPLPVTNTVTNTKTNMVTKGSDTKKSTKNDNPVKDNRRKQRDTVNLNSKYNPVSKYIRKVNYDRPMGDRRYNIRKASLNKAPVKQTAKRKNIRKSPKANNVKKGR